MARPSTAAVESAITQCQNLGMRTQQSAAVESLLAAWRLRRRRLPIKVRTADEVTAAMFGLRGDDLLNGRIYAFKSPGTKGGSLEQAGRATVWNTTTRGDTLARGLFQEATRPNGTVLPDFRGGPVENAAQRLGQILARDEDRRPTWRALAALLLRDEDMVDEDDARARLRDYLGAMDASGAVTPLSDDDLNAFTTDEPLAVPLLATSPEDAFNPDDLSADVFPLAAQTSEAAAAVAYDVVGGEVFDSRVERMLERAVRAYRAVLLVGPPGSGKNRLLSRLIDRARDNPDLLGLRNPPAEPLLRTPDESWTSFELIGGHAPVGEGLRYSSGAVLDAIATDRWLVLDETNRADMDKIFGALLSWLSMDDVTLGSLTPGGDLPVTLRWSRDQAASSVSPTAGLTATNGEGSSSDEPTDEICFRAGTDWRLLGTYNPQDAQRVFRFGVALSRRFAIVPVPPLDTAQFKDLLSRLRAADGTALPTTVQQRVAGLYAAHFVEPTTQLGQAVFLRIVDYVMSTLGGVISAEEGPGSADEEVPDDDAPDQAPDGDHVDEDAPVTATADTAVVDPILDALLAEAYLLRVGKYLSTYDDETFAALGQRITTGPTPALSPGQWKWVDEQRAHLG